MRSLRPALGIAAGTFVLLAGIAPATAGGSAPPRVLLGPAELSAPDRLPPAADGPRRGVGASDPTRPQPFMIQLDGRPAARAVQATRRSTGSATQAARSGRAQRSANVTAQASVMRTARQRSLVQRELYRVRTAYNGVAVMARPADLDRLRRIDGVRSVVPIPIHERHNARSVPTTGAGEVWAAAAGGNLGQGVRVGVLDSGVDYVHSTFGGSGTPADLADARSAGNNPQATGTDPAGFQARNQADETIYPNAVVVGGFDFVGDDYDSRYVETSVPRPDPNPMDCPAEEGGGHGTHVAGSLGGRGVTADGSTYAGGYDPVADDLRLGPGVAPGVAIYALRVFGCSGGTAFITQAIDWAVDPNQDGDPSDRLDVLNISAGSDFGDVESPEVAAARTASNLGVAIVVSAGNNGNLTHTVGSPGVAPPVLTVANLSTGEWADRVTVAGAAPGSDADGEHEVRVSSEYGWASMDADITGELVRAPEGNRAGCAPFVAPLTDKVVVVEARAEVGGALPCGSAVRSAHAAAAGAAGIVVVDVESSFGAGWAGTEEIPLVHAIAPTRTALLAALADGATPTLTFSPALVSIAYDPTNADTADESTSRGPSAGGGLKPEIGAPGSSIKSARSGSGTGTTVMGGTSMAAPHAAGAMALLRKHRVGWSVEELKAALVNTARPQVHVQPGHAGRRESTARVGSGALDVSAALRTTTVAYAKDADGAVAIGFGPLHVPVGAPFRVERAVRVVNKGLTAVTYAVDVDAITDVPGVTWELPDGASATVAAGATVDLRVRLAVLDPGQLRNARDETIPETRETWDQQIRQRWLAEATALLRLTSGATALSVPLHASLRPAAATSATSPVQLPAGDRDGALTFAGPTFDSGRTSHDFLATRIALEWQATSPRLPAADGVRPPARSDIEHVGVTERSGWLTFGVTTWGPNAAPGMPTTVVVGIDRDGDGAPELRVQSFRPDGTDSFMTCVSRVEDPEDPVGCAPSLLNRLTEEGGIYDSRLTLLSVPTSGLELDGSFDYYVATLDPLSGGVADYTGPMTFDPARPAIQFAPPLETGAGQAGLHADVPGRLPFHLDPERAAATGTRGALVLHPLGGTDQQAETIVIGDGAPRPVPPPADPPQDVVGPPPPPFLPHDLRLPQPPLPRMPVHRRQVRVAGGTLTLTGPRQCVKRGSRLTASLAGRSGSRAARFRRVIGVEFRIDGRRVATDRSAPFRRQLRASRLRAGALHRLTARATIQLRDGKQVRRSVTVRFRACG